MKLLILLALCIPFASALTIHGTVYDFDLSKLVGALVEINSSPAQRFVATTGNYSFTVPRGIYTLRATTKDLIIEEEVRALDEGDYVLDLILLPSLDKENELLSAEVTVPDTDFIDSKPSFEWIAWLFVFLFIGLGVFLFSRKNKQNKKLIPTDLQEILDFIHSQGGRANQKDIYKKFNYSEAKISLMLDDLESRELVQRIKKGRGNLILQK